MSDIDRIAIYKKLVSIQPFFADAKKVNKKKDAFETARTATLTVGAGGVWFENKTGGAGPPVLIEY